MILHMCIYVEMWTLFKRMKLHNVGICGNVDIIKANECSTMCRYVEMWRLLKRMKLHNVEICGDVEVIKANDIPQCGDMWRCGQY